MSTPEPTMAEPDWHKWAAQRRRLLVFIALAGLYLAGHVVFRWVVEPLLFEDDGCYGQAGPSWLEIGYHFFMTLLPVVAWSMALFMALSWSRVLAHRRIALLVLLAGLIFVEADMRWYQLSKKHVTISDIRTFLASDGATDLGLRASDYKLFWLLIGIHAAALVVCLLMSGPERKPVVSAFLDGPLSKTIVGKGLLGIWHGGAWLLTKMRVPQMLAALDTRVAVAVVSALVIVDPIVVWHHTDQDEAEEGYSLWRDVAETNPLRLQVLDRWVAHLANLYSDQREDLTAANADLDAAAAPAGPAKPELHVAKRSPPQWSQDIVVIQVESLNPQIVAETDMPVLQGLAAKSLRLNRHFSTGNCTHYGVLGLMWGTPVTFYQGGLDTARPCPYLEVFQNQFYRSRVLSRSLLHHHRLGDYLSNWSEPVFVAGSDAGVVPEFAKEMEKSGASFFYLFYHNTHFPYRHDDATKKYLPETSSDFSYTRSDLWRYKTEVINRYKNALVDFDRWLGEILAKVDLSKVIVVVTGDHGEEMLEKGRLGHCASLNKYQTMTPCLVHIPGVKPADINFTTSHADILPTIVDAMGWQQPQSAGLGRSLFREVPYRYAVVANFEFARPVRWAVVTDNRKAIVEEASGKNLQIVGLTDDDGHRLTYRDQPAVWRDSLEVIRHLQAEVNRKP